jgi:hypothetical protein
MEDTAYHRGVGPAGRRGIKRSHQPLERPVEEKSLVKIPKINSSLEAVCKAGIQIEVSEKIGAQNPGQKLIRSDENLFQEEILKLKNPRRENEYQRRGLCSNALILGVAAFHEQARGLEVVASKRGLAEVKAPGPTPGLR